MFVKVMLVLIAVIGLANLAAVTNTHKLVLGTAKAVLDYIVIPVEVERFRREQEKQENRRRQEDGRRYDHRGAAGNSGTTA